MAIVHWPECTNAPCTCGERGDFLLRSEKPIVIQRITGREPLTPNREGIWPPANISIEDFRKQYESFGDCVSCDGYILTESEKPHCPTCARLLREGKAL